MSETPDERAMAGKPRAGSVRLHAMQLGSEVIMVVTDDGRGVDLEALTARARRRHRVPDRRPGHPGRALLPADLGGGPGLRPPYAPSRRDPGGRHTR